MATTKFTSKFLAGRVYNREYGGYNEKLFKNDIIIIAVEEAWIISPQILPHLMILLRNIELVNQEPGHYRVVWKYM